MPYQTLITSILHKYVTGRLEERKPRGTAAVPKPKVTGRRTTRSDA